MFDRKKFPAGWDRKARRLVIEVKEVDSGRYIAGYAATFEPPDRHDDYGDIIAPTAFADTVKKFQQGEKKIKMLAHHDSGTPIGIWQELTVDDNGLFVVGKVSATRAGDEILALVNDGVIDSLSIGYVTKSARQLEKKTAWGAPVRELLDLDLKEVSPVTWPANEHARIMEVRSARTREQAAADQAAGLEALHTYLATLSARARAL